MDNPDRGFVERSRSVPVLLDSPTETTVPDLSTARLLFGGRGLALCFLAGGRQSV